MTAPDFTARPLIYIAGPYSSDPAAGTRTAIDIADSIATRGGTPLIPHLSLLWDLHRPRPVDWWYAYDLALLARCDAIYRIHGASTGADAEVAYAYRHGIPLLPTISVEAIRDLPRKGGA